MDSIEPLIMMMAYTLPSVLLMYPITYTLLSWLFRISLGVRRALLGFLTTWVLCMVPHTMDWKYGDSAIAPMVNVLLFPAVASAAVVFLLQAGIKPKSSKGGRRQSPPDGESQGKQ